MPADPLGPRKLYMFPIQIVLGSVLFVVGLAAAIEHGDWTWFVPLLGALLVGVTVLVLRLDPVDGPRRRLRDLRRRRGEPYRWR